MTSVMFEDFDTIIRITRKRHGLVQVTFYSPEEVEDGVVYPAKHGELLMTSSGFDRFAKEVATLHAEIREKEEVSIRINSEPGYGGVPKTIEVFAYRRTQTNGSPVYEVKGEALIAQGASQTIFRPECYYQFFQENVEVLS